MRRKILFFKYQTFLFSFTDAGAMWRSRYEEEKLVEIVDDLWKEVEPLYNELHTYVRFKLIELYGDKMDKYDDLIPAHLLGNMWAQNWVHLYDRIKPFKDASSVDVTKKMEEMNMNVTRMFEMSDEFYMSMGLPTSNMSFTGDSVIEKPEGVTIACHASAWDFCNGNDFRIKMCTKVNMEDFVVVHHEMGHIMYYLMYKDLPLIYRGGANPGFHEAVGDTIALSVATPKHLQVVGLLENYADSEADNINALFHMALERVAFLPFGLLIDKWRWDLFSNATPESEWNKHWWELREKYQKVRAPSTRGEEYFDAGAKYHIPADSQYIAYFVAHILEFSFYKSLCVEARQYDPSNPSVNPLHKCDFYNNTEAGAKLKAGLELGMSKPWSEALNVLTGSPQITATALMEYFAPLKDFLASENKKMKEARMKEILDEYEVEGSKMCNKMVKAEWAVATDSENDALKAEHEAVVLENNAFTRDFYDKAFKGEKPEDYEDELVQRQLKYLVYLGRDALNTADLSNVSCFDFDFS
jgi:peptidyl-dipeptidase A